MGRLVRVDALPHVGVHDGFAPAVVDFVLVPDLAQVRHMGQEVPWAVLVQRHAAALDTVARDPALVPPAAATQRFGRRGRRPRRPQAEVGVVGQFLGTAPGPLRKAALGQGLEPPRDALDKPGLVVRVRVLAERVCLLLPQLFHGHPLQCGDLFSDVQVHVWAPFSLFSETVNQCGH